MLYLSGITMQLSNDLYQSNTLSLATGNFVENDACSCPKCDYEHAENITYEEINGAVNLVKITRCNSCGYHSDAEDDTELNEKEIYYLEWDLSITFENMCSSIEEQFSPHGTVNGQAITNLKSFEIKYHRELSNFLDPINLLHETISNLIQFKKANTKPNRPMRERVLNAA